MKIFILKIDLFSNCAEGLHFSDFHYSIIIINFDERAESNLIIDFSDLHLAPIHTYIQQ